MDNLFNDQVVPVTKYDIEKFKKDYNTNCVLSEDLKYDSATNRYFTTSSEIKVKRFTNYYYNLPDNPIYKNGDLQNDTGETNFSGCYIDGYENTDNHFLTSKLLQENIDSKQKEINKSSFTGYYLKITFKGNPLKDKEILEQRFYTGIDDGHQSNEQGNYYKKDRVGYYPVFHTDNILELRKKPSEKFIKYFFYSLFTTILLAVIACCTEFWLIYSGDHTKRTGKDSEISIVIENSCTNIGKKDDKSYNCNILEQVFRWRIWNYPYQKCNDTIQELQTDANTSLVVGGAKSRYDYYYIPPKQNGDDKTDKGIVRPRSDKPYEECKVEGEKIEFGHRPFPYNIGEKADQLFTSELSRIIPRNVGYVILFIMLMYRYLVYHMFKNISNFYNESLKGLPIIKIIIFLASPILISLFINIVPILSTIGVLFFILFMIVQILQFFTDISNSGPSSPKMQSTEAFLVIIIFTILCYIISIIISEIDFNFKYNTAKRDRCSYVSIDEILNELKRLEYEARNQLLKEKNNTDKKNNYYKAKYNLIIFKIKEGKPLSDEDELDAFGNNYDVNNMAAYSGAADMAAADTAADPIQAVAGRLAAADQAIENIRNSKCLSESEFNSSFKTCQTAIDRYFSENHNILTGISSEAIKLESAIKINPTQTNGTISGNKIYVEEYLVNIVNNYISKVKSDKTAITGIFYTLLGCLGIFGLLYFFKKVIKLGGDEGGS